VKPQARPDGLAANAQPKPPSARSAALSRHYERVEADLLARGLLRKEGGAVDTPYSKADLAANFEQIAFYREYGNCGNLSASDGRAGVLRKWVDPVRVTTAFGASVPRDRRAADARLVEGFTARLSRVTGHPIAMAPNAASANFKVIFASEDDRDEMIAEVKAMVPTVCGGTLDLLERLPRNIYCLVLSFEDPARANSFNRAIAIVRHEHPELMREACVHEEMAQGLGLGNDSENARPSIFNDDEEFALLTTHDEELLRLLYTPSLRPGMTLREARPVIARTLGIAPGQT
jgi:hypothetical protein